MDTHTQVTQKSGISPKVTTVVKAGASTNSFSNEIGQVNVTQPSQGSTKPDDNRPEYYGASCEELGIYFPVPFNLIMGKSTEQLTRIFFHEGKYIIGPNGDRIGLSRLIKVVISLNNCKLIFNTGHRVDIPLSVCQVTYVPTSLP